MGKPKKPEKKKLITGIIYKDAEILKKAEAQLVRRFGSIDCKSSELPFVYTSYYAKEMGSNLKRKFIAFKQLIEIEKVYKVKLITNKLEHRLSLNKSRAINIDPGYISLSKLVLLTTKDYAHRVYLGEGIFGDLTMSFKEHSFHPGQYTYPDYRAKQYISFFNSIRVIYKTQLTLENNVLTR